MEMMKTNKLLTLCNPVLQLTLMFKNKQHGTDLSEDFGNRIKSALTQLEQEASVQQISLFEVQHMKYALAVFVDETILNSTWLNRAEWMGQPLQLQYFGEHVGGEGFFKRLTDLRQMGAQYTDLLEIYYVCLQLGFEGMYHILGLEKLLALQVDVTSQIEAARGYSDNKLSPAGLTRQDMFSKMSRKLPFWVILSSTATLIFGIYLSYAITINFKADASLQQINKSRSELMENYKMRGNSYE